LAVPYHILSQLKIYAKRKKQL